MNERISKQVSGYNFKSTFLFSPCVAKSHAATPRFSFLSARVQSGGVVRMDAILHHWKEREKYYQIKRFEAFRKFLVYVLSPLGQVYVTFLATF